MVGRSIKKRRAVARAVGFLNIGTIAI